MKNFKFIILFSILVLSSCSDTKEVFNEHQLQNYDNNSIDQLISLNEEIFAIAFANRHDFDEIINNENSIFHQKANEIENLIQEINESNPSLDIATILKENTASSLIQNYSEDDIAGLGTPCTEAFAASAATAALAYVVSVVASSGTATGVATILYAGALVTAAYNWCNCMENNYEGFEGC